MKRKIIISLSVLTVLVFLSFATSKGGGMHVIETGDGNSGVVEKVEVIHFHGTNQCWACITVGEMAEKTIIESFPDEYSEGIIIFMDINGELEENAQVVEKFQARGSSLFVNTVIDGVDNIEEDITVWRLVYNENQFKEYFSDKISNILNN